MNLKRTKETGSGLNVEFVNTDTNRHLDLKHVINQIERENPNYERYTTVTNPNGTTYVRSKPDKSQRNNIE